MGLPHFISDNIAILLVALVVLIAVILFLANKLMGSNSAPSTLNQDKENPLEQSPAAKAFRKKLEEISLDLDKK